jgi:phosphotriesterase-related protein
VAEVETVRGPVDVTHLGVTLMHEHVVNITGELARDYPDLSWPGGQDAVLERVVAQLREVRERGIETIVDATAFGHGRDVAFLQRVNELVDINIITSTGYYTYGDVPWFVKFRRPAPGQRDLLVAMFVSDITEGVAGTGVKAAIIKCATDAAGVTPEIERILRACAVAHRETGAPITTHTLVSERNGLDQQRIFREEGVDLTRVIIGHSGDSQDIDYLRELMDNGSLIGADRFGLENVMGFPSFEQRASTVARLCELGYADRIVLSHDVTLHTDWLDPVAPAWELPAQWVPTYISDTVLPSLRERGVSDEQIDAMMVGNPRRIFSIRDPY